MVYIPVEWIKHKDNMDKIHNIIDKLNHDMKTESSYTEDDAIRELEALGETTIIQKLKDNKIYLGA